MLPTQTVFMVQYSLCQANKGITLTAAVVATVCDPVMGDNGKLYVPRELVDIYAKEIVPHATILTPNSFECQ